MHNVGTSDVKWERKNDTIQSIVNTVNPWVKIGQCIKIQRMILNRSLLVYMYLYEMLLDVAYIRTSLTYP